MGTKIKIGMETMQLLKISRTHPSTTYNKLFKFRFGPLSLVCQALPVPPDPRHAPNTSDTFTPSPIHAFSQSLHKRNDPNLLVSSSLASPKNPKKNDCFATISTLSHRLER